MCGCFAKLLNAAKNIHFTSVWPSTTPGTQIAVKQIETVTEYRIPGCALDLICRCGREATIFDALPLSSFVLVLSAGGKSSKCLEILYIVIVQNPPPLRACRFESGLGYHINPCFSCRKYRGLLFLAGGSQDDCQRCEIALARA